MHLSLNAALVVIDLQKAIDDPSRGVRNNPEAEANVTTLLARWRETRRPIVHVRHFSRFPDSLYREGKPGAEFKSEAVPLEGERVVTKHEGSAFIGTDLEAWLRERGIAELVVVGVITNNSIEATARNGGDLGFRVIVVSDATFTFARRDFHGRPRSADEVHDMSLANLDGEYAAIWTAQQVIEATASETQHP